MAENSTKSLSELLQSKLHKDPVLASKQLRLLQMLNGSTNSQPPVDSNDSPSSEATPATPTPSKS